MAYWRIGRSWSKQDLHRQLKLLSSSSRNFDDEPEELDRRPNWHSYSSESVIANAEPGPPESPGPFQRARAAVIGFEFSDPAIVRAYFDKNAPLLHRRMLLELKAFRIVRFLAGVFVGEVREESTADATVFGYQYHTLEGHIERGAEWFLLTKEHDTGALRFRISARWMPGDFPNWWSRLGFQLVGRHYQKKWHRRAHVIMADMIRDLSPPEAAGGRRDFSKADIIFERTK